MTMTTEGLMLAAVVWVALVLTLLLVTIHRAFTLMASWVDKDTQLRSEVQRRRQELLAQQNADLRRLLDDRTRTLEDRLTAAGF